MLKELHIKNYALIESLNIELSKGYSVITGETGAGKSIILGALSLLQGVRSDAKTIKFGEKKCIVEGYFIPENDEIALFLNAHDIDDDEICILRREVLDNGKSRAFINDTPVSLTILKELSTLLIDIHSQHQNLLLGRERFLLDTLDIAADNSKEKKKYEEAYRQWREAERKLQELLMESVKNDSDSEFLKFQLQQLEEANLNSEELDDLEEEATMLRHAEEIKTSLYQAYNILSSDSSSVSSIIRASKQEIESIANVFTAAENLSERIESCRIELDDITDEINRQASNIEYDSERLAFVDDRLNTLYSLLKKHKVDTIAELIAIGNKTKERLSKIEDIDSYIENASAIAENAKNECYSAAEKLSETRKHAAAMLTDKLTKSLKELGMPHASLNFSLTQRTAPDTSGNDNVVLFFSANKDVPMQNVAQIASGGEIARLMLAIKVFISSFQNLPTIIFDEIDTGVSGTMAEKMAKKMKEVAVNSQVICITHLPQIAAMGDLHFLVYKEENSKSISTQIRLLSDEERIMELANMLSGEKMTSAAIDNAKALLNAK